MNYFASALLLLVAGTYAHTVSAQTNESWVTVAPNGGEFTVQMPRQPASKTQQLSYDPLKVEAQVYTAAGNGIEYTLWSMRNLNPDYHYANSYQYSYLDNFADLTWESLLKPLRDKLPVEPKPGSRMSFQGESRELFSSGLPGRTYFVLLGTERGIVNIFANGDRVYILTALNAGVDDPSARRFFTSFVVKPEKPVELVVPVRNDPPSVGTGVGAGVGPADNVSAGGGVGIGAGTGGGVGTGAGVGPPIPSNSGGGDAKPANTTVDYNRSFNGKDVTERARVLSRPPPRYTEEGRKYLVNGTVAMRAVMNRSGQVTNIVIVKGLPHGLTQSAIDAAKLIKFEPATKDGHQVSQYVLLEFNFNIF
jgi:TonB family protein